MKITGLWSCIVTPEIQWEQQGLNSILQVRGVIFGSCVVIFMDTESTKFTRKERFYEYYVDTDHIY